MKISIPILSYLLGLSTALEEQEPLRLLAFGDSLTAGMTDWGSNRHPYTGTLKSSLQTKYPNLNVTTDNQGQSGDQVTSPPGEYLPRMTALYKQQTPSSNYTHAIILGGTNDLTHDRIAPDLFINLQKVWDIPLSHGTRVLALTVPESGNYPGLINERRGEVNELILAHKEPGFYTFDLATEVPFWSMPEDERKKIWDDGTHFTSKGYDLIGKLLAERIAEIISIEETFEHVEQGDVKAELR